MADAGVKVRAGAPPVAVPKDNRLPVDDLAQHMRGLERAAAQSFEAGSILWAPLSEPQRVSFAGTSFANVRRALHEVFGSFPMRLSLKQLPVLQGMAAAAGDGRGPFVQLADALTAYGEIEVREV